MRFAARLRPALFALLLLAPAAPRAQELLGPGDFRAYAEGRTLYFALSGTPFGAEQYLPGNRVIWQYADGSCTRGIWYARQALICFVYEGDGAELCWQFLQDGQRFLARSVDAEPAAELEVIGRDRRPLSCPGPGVGV